MSVQLAAPVKTLAELTEIEVNTYICLWGHVMGADNCSTDKEKATAISKITDFALRRGLLLDANLIYDYVSRISTQKIIEYIPLLDTTVCKIKNLGLDIESQATMVRSILDEMRGNTLTGFYSGNKPFLAIVAPNN